MSTPTLKATRAIHTITAHVVDALSKRARKADLAEASIELHSAFATLWAELVGSKRADVDVASDLRQRLADLERRVGTLSLSVDALTSNVKRWHQDAARPVETARSLEARVDSIATEAAAATKMLANVSDRIGRLEDDVYRAGPGRR